MSVNQRIRKQRMSAGRVRQNLRDVLNRVEYNGERIEIERHGKTAGYLVPAEDVAALERLEAMDDTQSALEILAANEEPVPWREARKILLEDPDSDADNSES